MNAKPKCIVIAGRPGSGKSTLAAELAARLHLPRISRDEIMEGYVNTFGVRHDQLPGDTNGRVNEAFFETALTCLRACVSTIVEAAFQHKLWRTVMPRLQAVSRVLIVVCDLDAETSARRHLQRGLADPTREFFHGDRRVAIFRRTGRFEPGGQWDPPAFDEPTLRVSTRDGYEPCMERILGFLGPGEH
jgi:predicted kinase